MGPVEKSLPSVLDFMREDGASPIEGRPLSIERVYQANIITYEQYLAILDEWTEERRRERNAEALSEMDDEQSELEFRMRKANVPAMLINVPIDVTCGDALASGKWLYVHSDDSEDATMRACMALKGWLKRTRFGTAAFVRSTSALSAFRENEAGEAMRLTTVGMLVISGLGAEAATDWAVGKLYELLDTRALNGLPTVVSSVHSPDELSQHFGGRGNDGAAWAIVGILKKHSLLVEA